MQIQSLPASTGTAWVLEGWRFLRRQPIGLTAMVVLYLFLVSVPMSVPVIGPILYAIVYPYANVGLLAAFREVASGRLPTPAVLGEALRDESARRSLFKLAMVHIGMVLVVVAFAFVIMSGVEPLDPATAKVDDLPLGRMFLVLLVYLPVVVAMLFAPVLVGWHGFSVGKALFGSAIAFWRNKGAIVLCTVIVFTTVIVVGAMAEALVRATLPAEVAPWIEAPVALVLATFAAGALFAMYRAIFHGDTPPAG